MSSVNNIRSIEDLVQLFSERDANRDGKLAIDELDLADRADFDKLDANSDQFLSSAEIASMRLPEDASAIFRTANQRGFALPDITTRREMRISGYLLSKGSNISFRNNGELFEITTSAPLKTAANTFPANSTLRVHEQRVVHARIEADATIDGKPCKADTEVAFYPSGRIKSFTPSQDVEIKGVWVKAGSRVTLYDTGEVREATLARTSDFRGAKYKEGTEVTLSRSKEVYKGTLAEAKTMQGLAFPPGTKFERYPVGGVITTLVLGQDVTCSFGTIPAGSQISIVHSFRGEEWMVKLGSDARIDRVIYKGGTELKIDSQSKVVYGVLAADATLLGHNDSPVACMAGHKIFYNNNGKVLAATSAQDQTILGKTVSKGTSFFIPPLGPPFTDLPIDQASYPIGGPPNEPEIWLEGPAVYRGFKIRDKLLLFSDGSIASMRLDTAQEVQGRHLRAGSLVEFHRNGVIKGCELNEPIAIPGTAARIAGDSSFDEKGSPIGGILVQDVTIDGVRYAAGTYIHFTDKGKVDNGVAIDATIGGIKLPPMTRILFDKKQLISIAFFPCDFAYKGIVYKKDKIIYFEDNGDVSAGTLAEKTKIGDIEIPAESHVDFADGKLSSVGLSSSTTIQGLALDPEERVFFHPNGRIDRAVLAQEASIQGMKIPAGSRVVFYANGNLELVDTNAWFDGKREKLIQVRPLGGDFVTSSSYMTFHENGRPKSMLISRDLILPVKDILSHAPLPVSLLVGFLPESTVKMIDGKSEQHISLKNFIRLIADYPEVEIRAGEVRIEFNESGLPTMARKYLSNHYEVQLSPTASAWIENTPIPTSIPLFGDYLKIIDRELAAANPQ